jgi:Holliday junction resolvasome RuvABC endonuclease subunit
MGVCVLQFDSTTPPTAIDAYVIRTDKRVGKYERVTDDDRRRMHTLWFNVRQTVEQYKPARIAVEAYTVYRASQGGHRGNGSGWKALYGYLLTMGVAFEREIPVSIYQPADLHRRVGSAEQRSKWAVEQAVGKRVAGITALLAGIPATEREHAADACGHAFMAWEDMCSNG